MQRLLILSSFLLFVFIPRLFAISDDVFPSQLIDSAKSALLRKNFSRGEFYFKQIIAKSEQRKDTASLLKSLWMLEKFYTEQGHNDSAITICQRRLTINRQKKNYVGLSDNFRALNTLLITGIGSHTTSGLLDSCLFYALLSQNNNAIAVAYTNYGLYIIGSNKRLGLKYLTSAIEQSKRTPNEVIYIYSRVQTAKVLIWLDSLNQAKEYLSEALEKAIETNEKTQLTHVYIALGSICIKEGRTNDGLSILHKARVIAETGPYIYYLPDIYESLAQAFRQKNEIDSSFFYRDKATAAEKQLVNERTNQQVAEVNAKYQLEGQQSAINRMDVKISTYKRILLFIGLGLFVVVAFITVYIFKINEMNTRNNTLKGNSAKGAKKMSSPLPLSFKGFFEDIFIKGESYTQPDITLQKLSDLLCTNTTYLSRFINEEYKVNFSQLLNHYRIEKACSLLLDVKMDNLTIEAIAKAAGFNSKSTFNTAFRNQKGITPTQWKETCKNAINQ